MADHIADRFSPLTLSRHRHAPLIAALAATAAPAARSGHFCVYRLPDDVVIVHDLAATAIDNGLAGYVADELLPLLAAGPGSSTGGGFSPQQLFEGCVGAIVRSIDGSERHAWHLFYANTLSALGASDPASGPPDRPAIADFRAIYRQAEHLIGEAGAATILDAATCFGFLPLLLATRGKADGHRRILGCDQNRALVALAEDYRQYHRIAGVRFVHADVLADDLQAALSPATPFDCVTAIHLLEHLAPDETLRAIDHLWALTRRRLILAVPLEATPDARFGHRQVFDLAHLAALGARTTGHCRSFDDHGGWLVIDRREARRRPHRLVAAGKTAS